MSSPKDRAFQPFSDLADVPAPPWEKRQVRRPVLAPFVATNPQAIRPKKAFQIMAGQ
jgi:hypothetical protein